MLPNSHLGIILICSAGWVLVESILSIRFHENIDPDNLTGDLAHIGRASRIIASVVIIAIGGYLI